jgi:hypothetical protein
MRNKTQEFCEKVIEFFVRKTNAAREGYAVKGVSKEHYYNIAHSTCLQYISIARREVTRKKGLPMNLNYTRVGDYLLPNIVLGEPPNAEPIGKYGAMRRAYLKEHRPNL